MKLYRTQHHEARGEEGGVGDDQTLQLRYHWQGTQADAATCRRQLKEAGKKDIETTEIDVPTDKAGLLAWLNANVTGE
jgi:hypothetical protein